MGYLCVVNVCNFCARQNVVAIRFDHEKRHGITVFPFFVMVTADPCKVLIDGFLMSRIEVVLL